MMGRDTLVIWLIHGETLCFENVTALENNDDELTFDYVEVSSGAERSVVFNQINIAGFALES